jgi:hypothetical protein
MKAKEREQTLEQVINEALSPSRVKHKNNDAMIAQVSMML